MPKLTPQEHAERIRATCELLNAYIEEAFKADLRMHVGLESGFDGNIGTNLPQISITGIHLKL